MARGRAPFLLIATIACAIGARAVAAPAPCVPAAPPRPLPLRALDLALLEGERLIVLDGAEIALVAIGRELGVLSRAPMPGPLAVVRAPGGLLAASEREGAVWAMTSRSPHAVLFAVEGTQLVERQRAEALPFPGAARGLRFRAGTNLIEGDVPPLGSGPFLDLAGAGALVAVDPAGRLLVSEPSDVRARAGPTLAPLWPRRVATSLPAPPGIEDAIVVLDVDAPGAPLFTCAAAGPVRAIAARVRDDSARLAYAVEGPDARSWLHLVDVARPGR